MRADFPIGINLGVVHTVRKAGIIRTVIKAPALNAHQSAPVCWVGAVTRAINRRGIGTAVALVCGLFLAGRLGLQCHA